MTVTISKGNSVPATVMANNSTYDGTEKPLITVDESMLVGGTMQFALGTATEPIQPYNTAIPIAAEAGTYYVWYMVKGNENYNDSEADNVEVTIAEDETKKDINNNTNNNTNKNSKRITISKKPVSVKVKVKKKKVTVSWKKIRKTR